MKFRKAKLSDAQALSTLALSLAKYYADNESISPFFAKKITVEAFETYLQDSIAYEHYVYEKEGRIVAYFSLLNATHFLYLFVDEKYHKQGIAKALVEYALKGKNERQYQVSASLYAVPFYEKLGFVKSALVQENNGMSYLFMVWDCDNKRHNQINII
jgi:GNAT superfamily N-acetyltransferase